MPDPIEELRAEFVTFREAAQRRETEAIRRGDQLAEIVREHQKNAPVPDVVRPPGQARFFRQEDLKDFEFVQANRAEIMEAIRLGHIIPRTDWQVPGAKGSRR